MPNDSRTVYTTESGRVCPKCGKPQARCTCARKKASATPAAPQFPNDGVVRVAIEKKGRGGKTVTLVAGLSMPDERLRETAAELKRRCGTGGTVKDGLIEIQGDHRDTLLDVLTAMGHRVKRVG